MFLVSNQITLSFNATPATVHVCTKIIDRDCTIVLDWKFNFDQNLLHLTFTIFFPFSHKVQASIKTELWIIFVAKPFAIFPRNRCSASGVSSSLKCALFYSDATSDCRDIVVILTVSLSLSSSTRLSFLVFLPSLTYRTYLNDEESGRDAGWLSVFLLLVHWRTHFAKEIQVTSGYTGHCVRFKRTLWLSASRRPFEISGRNKARFKGHAFPYLSPFPRKLPPPVFQNFC